MVATTFAEVVTPYWEWTQYPNTQPRVGASMTLKLSILDSPNGDLITGLGGFVTISASPQGAYAGTMSVVANDQIISAGYAIFECSFDDYGIYQIGAAYNESPSPASPSPSPDYSISLDNPDIYVLNELPVLSTITPDSVDVATPSQTITLAGANFYSTSTAIFSDPLIGGVLQPRSTSFTNSTSIDADLISVDMATAGIKTLRVKNIFSGPNGIDEYSNTLNLAVEGSSEFLPNDFEKLPTTIGIWKTLVTPPEPFTPDLTNEAFQRRYPTAQSDLVPVTLAQVNAGPVSSATVGGVPNLYPKNANGANVDILGYVLSQVVKTTVATVPIGTSNAGPGIGAWEVLDIHKGAYNGTSFNQQSGAGASWAPKLSTIADARTPLILRAHKNAAGVPDSIVMMRKQTSTPTSGSTLSLTTTAANKSWNYHFYDWKIEHSGNTAFFSAGALNNGPGDSDIMHKGIKFVRCDAMGTWDARGVNLTPDRFTISVMADPMTGQSHYDMSGNVIPHVLGNPAQDASIRAWEVLLMQQGSTLKSCASYWTSDSEQGRWSALHIPMKAAIGGTLPIGYTSTPTNQKYWVRLRWVTSSGVNTNYYGNGTNTAGPLGIGSRNLTVGNIDSSGFLTFVDVPLNGYLPAFEYTGPENPLSGQVVGGMAHYPMVKFRYPGIYSFEAELVDRSTGVDVPVGWLAAPGDTVPTLFTTTVTVMATSTGMSQNKCYAQRIANVPQVNMSELSLAGKPASEDFVMPMVLKQTHLLHAAGTLTSAGVGGTNFNIYGTFKYVIDAASFTAGWRWLKVDGTYLTTDWAYAPMSDGVLSHPPLAADWAPNLVNTPSRGARLVYIGTGILRRGLVTNITITVLKCNLQFGQSGGVASTIQIANIQQDGVPGGTPFTFTVPVCATTTASSVGALPTLSTMLDTSVIQGGKGMGNVSGTPFAAGWPGNPSHPNYEPGHESLYPNNTVSVCPGMLYGGGLASKWAAYPSSIDDFQWIGGNIHHSAYEHGMYLHVTLNTVIKDVNFFRTGRTGFQWHNRRQENWYLGTVVPDDFIVNGPVWAPLVIDGCTFRDTGNEDDGADGISIAEHAGPITISNCFIDARFLEQLKHNPSNGGMGGIVIYDGTPCKPDTITANPTAGKVTNNFMYPFLVDVNGVPLITGPELNTLINLNGCVLQAPTNQNVLSHIQTLLGNYPILKEWNSSGHWRDVQAQYSSTWNIPLGSTLAGAHLTHPDHPSNNRYFGDPGNPLGGGPGYWTPISAPQTGPNNTKIWPVIDGTGATRYVGEPTNGSLHQIGPVTLLNNICQASGSAPYPFKHPNWPSIGARANVKLSGMRQLSLVGNTFFQGLKAALSINNRADDLATTPPGRVPVGWWGESWGNQIFPSTSFTYHGIDDPIGHAPILTFLTKPSPAG